ncbi:MAG: YlxR family protein [Acidimicrobiales bacterium]
MGCRKTAPQDELVRVVRRPDGGLQLGRALPGRGAWLCAGSPACARAAERRGAFGRALRGPVRAEEVGRLVAQLGEHPPAGAGPSAVGEPAD